MTDVATIYRDRFENSGLERRDKVWKVLCRYFFQERIPENATVIDLACGYGEFINNILAGRKFAVDLNPDAARYLSPTVIHRQLRATELASLGSEFADVVFTSNFLEHLQSKQECDVVLAAVRKILRPGGKFIIMGPNIRYASREYWDFYDHYLPLSHLSLAEGLRLAGFRVTENIPRFMPYTMANGAPTHDFLVRAYLAIPLAWRFLGKQFLVTAVR
ncbi:MAG TPA: methyltransferase domain-containing protein [Roseiarcus sp.]